MFLYDEATTGLDPVNADRICRLINELCKDGTGMIIVTHKVVDAFKVAKRFLFLQTVELSLMETGPVCYNQRILTYRSS